MNYLWQQRQRDRIFSLLQDLRTDATHGKGGKPCAPTDGSSNVNLRKSCPYPLGDAQDIQHFQTNPQTRYASLKVMPLTA